MLFCIMTRSARIVKGSRVIIMRHSFRQTTSFHRAVSLFSSISSIYMDCDLLPENSYRRAGSYKEHRCSFPATAVIRARARANLECVGILIHLNFQFRGGGQLRNDCRVCIVKLIARTWDT